MLTCIAGTTYNTTASSLTGHPSMTIPVGAVSPLSEDVRNPEDQALKLPVGMMIVGKHHDEAMVFRIGDAWERAGDWRKQ